MPAIDICQNRKTFDISNSLFCYRINEHSFIIVIEKLDPFSRMSNA
jgi:hypothetical protein